MDYILQIVTANFTEVNRLINEDYICVSIVGKVYGEYYRTEDIQRIRSLNTFRHYWHIKAKDWYACNLLYRAILKKKGIERLKADLNDLAIKNDKSKIALCGYGVGDAFCYRHVLSDYLNANGVNVTEVGKIDSNTQKAYWKYNIYKDRGHDNLTDEFISETLKKCNWIFAKTAINNPHFYSIRKDFDDRILFLSLVKHIRYFGKDEIFQGVLYRVFYVGGYMYWSMPEDLTNENCDLINRKLI